MYQNLQKSIKKLQSKNQLLEEQNENLKAGVQSLDKIASDRLQIIKSLERQLEMSEKMNRIQKETMALMEGTHLKKV